MVSIRRSSYARRTHQNARMIVMVDQFQVWPMDSAEKFKPAWEAPTSTYVHQFRTRQCLLFSRCKCSPAEEEPLRLPPTLFGALFGGHIQKSETASKKTYISPFWVFVDIDHEQCVFPGDGSQPLVLTHSTDLAAYIERLVGLPSEDWPRESLIASNKLQVKDLEPLIKKVTGKDFKVTYDSVEAIRKGHITPLPSNQAVFEEPAKGEMFHEVELQVMLSMLSNAHDLPGKNLAELFPDVQTTNIEDFLRAGWTLKQSTIS